MTTTPTPVLPADLPPGYLIETLEVPHSEGLWLLWFTEDDTSTSRPVTVTRQRPDKLVYPSRSLALFRAWQHHEGRVKQAEARARERARHES